MDKNNNIVFRPLRKEEIKLRCTGITMIPNATPDGRPDRTARFLGEFMLYKNARVDQNILDETVGNANWKLKVDLQGDGRSATAAIAIKINDEWVEKSDAGMAGDYSFDQCKAAASDAVKRAGFAWGIGRALYESPKVMFDLYQGEFEPGRNNPSKLYLTQMTNFFVSRVEYNESNTEITGLEIRDIYNNVRYSYKKPPCTD